MIYKFKTLDRGETITLMTQWLTTHKLPRRPKEYDEIRSELKTLFEQSKEEVNEFGVNSYQMDINFGVRLYIYLSDKPWFNMRTAVDPGFWRYLSIVVVPDLIAARYGYSNEEHYWKKSSRIWFRAIWWFVHIGWQGNPEKTIELLTKKMFNTDTILNIVERTGRKGVDFNLYSTILKAYSMVEDSDFIGSNIQTGSRYIDLLRAVMKLHTAKSLVLEPALCLGGTNGYVLSLFNDLGINTEHIHFS